jgi:hypothetical protein
VAAGVAVAGAEAGFALSEPVVAGGAPDPSAPPAATGAPVSAADPSAPPVAAADASPPLVAPSDTVAAVTALERLASRASFLAQPEPLNTMAGADRARFREPSQRWQVVGPGAEIPWITSTTWPHDSHT